MWSKNTAVTHCHLPLWACSRPLRNLSSIKLLERVPQVSAKRLGGKPTHFEAAIKLSNLAISRSYLNNLDLTKESGDWHCLTAYILS